MSCKVKVVSQYCVSYIVDFTCNVGYLQVEAPCDEGISSTDEDAVIYIEWDGVFRLFDG